MNLTRQLALLYPADGDARTIVSFAEIPEGQIDYRGGALAMWASIVRAASLHQKIPSLVDAARAEYPDDAVLREAAETLGRDPHALDLLAETAPSRAPQQVGMTTLVLVGAIVLAGALDLPRWAILSIVAICLVTVLPTLQYLVSRFTASSPAGMPTRKQLADPDVIDLDSGLFGGLAGGLVTGVLLAVVYHEVEPRAALPRLIVQVALTFGIAVAVLGLFVAFITSKFVDVAKRKPRGSWMLNEITASVLAGLIAGPVAGIGLAFHYGQYHGTRRFADPPLLLTGILPGCVVIGVFMAVWNQRPLAPRLMRSIATSIAAAGLVGLPAQATAVLEPALKQLMYSAGAVIGGSVYGLLLGGICGLVIGISLFLSRHWVRRELSP
jgi:hypothetical protein